MYCDYAIENSAKTILRETGSLSCVYLTTYLGNKLPPFYIGSAYIRRIQKGYRGSVASQRYMKTWYKEKRENPHLFKTKILETFNTREEATQREEDIQRRLNVVKNPLYVNCTIANKEFRYGDRTLIDKMAEINRGKKRSDEFKQKLSQHFKGRKHTAKARANMSEGQKRRAPPSEETKRKISEAMKGKRNRAKR
jgi:hypothetical protein